MKAEIKIKKGYFKKLENPRDIYGEWIDAVYQEVDLFEAPLWWQEPGNHLRFSYTSSGYGAKIPTRWKVKFNNRMLRVYSTCYGNSGSLWIQSKGVKYFVSHLV